MARGFAATGNKLRAVTAPVTGTGARSVAFRIRTSDSNNNYIFGWGGLAGAGAHYRMRLDAGRPRFEQSGGNWVATNTINNGAWRGVSVSHPASDDGSGAVLYIDGTAESASSSTTGQAINTDTDAAALNEHGTGGSGLASQMAEFAVWSIELTADEHSAVTTGISPRLIRPASLVRHWELVGGILRCRITGELLTVTGTASLVSHPSVYVPASPQIITAPAAVAAAASFPWSAVRHGTFRNHLSRR